MNRPMDDLLRDTLRSRAADANAACVDAETAAALVDGTLSARARSSAEAHIADCPRCQAVLAALVRSTPPPTPRTWWRRPAFTWFVPAAVAAGAAAIWVNVPDQQTVPVVQTPREMQRELAPPIEAVPIQPTPTQPTVDGRPSVVGNRQSTAAPAASVKDARDAAYEFLRARQAVGGTAKASSSASADVSSPPEARQDAAPSDLRMAAAPPAPAPVPAPPASAPAPRIAGVAERVAVLTPTIVSFDRTSQWRIAADGEVQHSADGGASWQTQAIGAGLTPLAGSSPSASVCWVVGGDGLVLITTDRGLSWRRLPFPVVIDLASIRATDDRTATIVSIDGRTFTTSDAGSSWQP